MDDDDCRHCYICNAYYADRVKLGVHLLRCYHEAVHVRGELWHPHPSDLMDKEENYTAYMRRNRQKAMEEERRLLQQRNIAVASADAFANLRTALDGPRPASRPGRPEQALPSVAPPLRGGGGAAPGAYSPPNRPGSRGDDLRAPPSRGQATPSAQPHVHFPPRISAHEELPTGKVGHPSPDRLRSPPMQGHASPLHRGSDGTTFPQAEYRPPTHEMQRGSPYQAQPQSHVAFNEALESLSGSKLDRQRNANNGKPVPQASAFHVREASETPLEGGLLQCPKCGKRFGKKGFAVHVPRCGLDPVEDFTHSRDARREGDRPLGTLAKVGEVMPPTEGEEGPSQEKWTQFMVTYPRPVLDEAPLTAVQRNKQLQDQQRKKEERKELERLNDPRWQEVQQQKEVLIQCKHCRQMFNQDKVQKHMVMCNAQPRPF